MHKKSQFLTTVKENDIINDVFVIKGKKAVEEYKNGYRFELRIGDHTKEMYYKYWGSDDELFVKNLYDSLQKGDVVLLQGRVNKWNEKLEISANADHQIQKLKEGEFDVSDFVKKSEFDETEMWNEVEEFISSIKNEEIKAVVTGILHDGDIQKQFRFSPAAMYIHHGWIHGLLEHTLAVTKIAAFICTVHKELDRDYVVAGALLHDVGKIDEFTVKTSIEATAQAQLIGHVSILTEKLGKLMDKLGTSHQVRMKLQHMIITHMGEYGSSITPSFPEALAVHLADNTDGQLDHMFNLIAKAETDDDFFYHKDFGSIYRK